jgi:hypothetical protein
MTRLEMYWEAVQERVCKHCIDSDRKGNCRLSANEECGVKVHFPAIVETVLAVQNDRLDPYVKSLRDNVCASCRHQSADGTCVIRNHVDCALDRYYPMIVEAIEAVSKRTLTAGNTVQ